MSSTQTSSVLRPLAEGGTILIALRAAGFNNVDLATAAELGIRIGRVPAYSPYAVAEHAVALILSLDRLTHRAFNRVREGNFALDGVLGFDLHGRCVGIVGSGRIGTVFARIMAGFGCRLMACDPYPNHGVRDLGARYVELPELFAESDIIQDDTFARLLTFPNVLITAHQAFFTTDALERIAETTMANLTAFERDGAPLHEVSE